MQTELTPHDIDTIVREADAAARRLRRRLYLPIGEREDLSQDLLIDLLRRLPAFDPSRGSIGAFANIVLRNQSSRIAIRFHRQRREQGGSLLSIESPIAGSGEPFGETLTEDDGLAAWHGQDCCAAAQTERSSALQSALARLPTEDRSFCAALAHRPVTALVAEGFGSRSALYRRLADLRHVLTAYGLGPDWDDLVAA